MKRRVSNPLALAVLAQLMEQPMHPYEIAAQMRYRGIDQSIKLNYGSLYSVVEVLQKIGFIVAQETQRAGDRPERTVYALTDPGRIEFLDWLRDLVRQPTKEYTQFAAGLTFMEALPPAEALALLQERAVILAGELRDRHATIDEVSKAGVGRLFLIEAEHEVVLRAAELVWVQQLVEEIRDGTLTLVKNGELVWKAVEEELAKVGSVREEPEGEREGET